MFFKTIKELRNTNEKLKKEKNELRNRLYTKDHNIEVLLKQNSILNNAICEIRQESQKNQYNSVANYKAKINKILETCKSNLAS